MSIKPPYKGPEINPCPFCGEMGYLSWAGVLTDIKGYRVYCNSSTCKVAGPLRPSPDEAIAAWNKVLKGEANG